MPPYPHPCHPASAARDRITDSKLQKVIFLFSGKSYCRAVCVMRRSRVMAQDVIEELTREDLQELRECIETGLVFTDSRPVRLPWCESLEWCEFYDVGILQASGRRACGESVEHGANPSCFGCEIGKW